MKFFSKRLVKARQWLKRLVNANIPSHSIEFSQHFSFIGTHLLAVSATLIASLAYIISYGWTDYVVLGGIGLLLLPILIVLYLSYFGNIKQAQFLSSTNLVMLAGYGAYFTGGVSSFLVPWLAIAPFEAAISGSRRAVIWSISISCIAVGALFGLDHFALMPISRVASLNPDLLNVFGIASAAIYAGGISLAIHKLNLNSNSAQLKGERRFRLAAENATDMISRHSPSGSVLFISGSAQRLFGCDTNQLMGDGLIERIHPEDREIYLQSIVLTGQTKETISVEFRIGSFSQSNLNEQQIPPLDDQWVEMRCRPLTRSNDRLTSLQSSEIVAVTRDVSERKRQQIELKRARDEAEKASLAKTRFLANMSHELRTPLNAIIGFSEVLQSKSEVMKQNVAEQEYIGLIHSSGIHLLNVVNSLLDMSKIEFGKMELDLQPLNISDIVRLCISLMQPITKESDVEIAFSPSDDTVSLVGDQQACKQIILNLMSNAVKYSKPGGKVEITLNRSRSHVEIIISDEGIGIAEHILPTLTEPFAQVENTYDRTSEGTGLGLSIVNGLVGLHGGSLTLESEMKVGTRAIVKLPLDARTHEQDRRQTKTVDEITPPEKTNHAQNG